MGRRAGRLAGPRLAADFDADDAMIRRYSPALTNIEPPPSAVDNFLHVLRDRAMINRTITRALI